MGMEEYGVRLVPDQHPIKTKQILADLTTLGYTQLPGSVHVSGAILATPPADEFFLVDEERDYIIEALLKTQDNGDDVRYLSLRFAVCQPDAVLARFRETVYRIAEKYQMQVSDGVQTYDAHSKELHQQMNRDVSAKKQRWTQIFKGDTEETKITPGEAWRYFQNKSRRQELVPHGH